MNWLVTQTYLKYLAVMVRNRVTPGHHLALPSPKENDPSYFLTGMLRIKNEGRFLPELLAYHHILGFEHFYLYNNNSEDHPHDVLAPFIQRGLLTIVDWPKVPASPSCYFHFWENYASRSQWVSFFDADEFLVEREPGVFLDLLRKMKTAPALALNWRYYGSSYQESLPAGLLIENFTRRENSTNTHVKVVVQPAKTHSPFNSHNFVYRFGKLARSWCGDRVLGSRYLEAGEPPVWLNHYVYRSRENVIAKAKQGFVDAQGAAAQARNLAVVNEHFQRHNDIEDDTAARNLAEKVTDLLREMGYQSPHVSPRAA